VKTNFKTLKIESKGKIVIVGVNRPKQLNALNEQVLGELKEFLFEVKDTDFSGIILKGEGDKAFIAGADIKGMNEMNEDQGEVFAQLGQEVSTLFEKCSLPVIACVDGYALGGGCEMAMSCDFIYGTKSAVFGQPEVNLGLIPGFGGTQRLVRYVGAPMAKELIYTGRNVMWDEAVAIGLIQKVFETSDEMFAAAEKTLETIGKKSPIIVSKCKEVINRGEFLTIEEGLCLEKKAFRWVFSTEDQKEGVSAFVEKRKPCFKGR